MATAFKVFGLAIAIAACDSGPGYQPHDQLTDCPSWIGGALHDVQFCEAACQPRPREIPDGCSKASTPTMPDTLDCYRTSVVDGILGCCMVTGLPVRILWYECPPR